MTTSELIEWLRQEDPVGDLNVNLKSIGGMPVYISKSNAGVCSYMDGEVMVISQKDHINIYSKTVEEKAHTTSEIYDKLSLDEILIKYFRFEKGCERYKLDVIRGYFTEKVIDLDLRFDDREDITSFLEEIISLLRVYEGELGCVFASVWEEIDNLKIKINERRVSI